MLVVFFMVAIFPIKRYQTLLGNPVAQDFKSAELENEKPLVLRISRYVKKISFLFPKKRRCLVQSVTTKLLLNRRKIDSLINFGVAVKDSHLKAHAWVTYGSITLFNNDNSKFTQLLTIC